MAEIYSRTSNCDWQRELPYSCQGAGLFSQGIHLTGYLTCQTSTIWQYDWGIPLCQSNQTGDPAQSQTRPLGNYSARMCFWGEGSALKNGSDKYASFWPAGRPSQCGRNAFVSTQTSTSIPLLTRFSVFSWALNICTQIQRVIHGRSVRLPSWSVSVSFCSGERRCHVLCISRGSLLTLLQIMPTTQTWMPVSCG